MEILYKDLSYKIQGLLMEVRNIYSPGHKEIVYNNALEELFVRDNIKYQREVSLIIKSPVTGKNIGVYRPDFLINNKIIVEVKAVDIVPKNFIDQIYSYLRISNYELGIFVNFKSPELYIKRVILTNDRKINSLNS